MKTTLLSILLCVTPTLVTQSRAEEETPDAPHEEKREEPRGPERMQKEMTRFREEMQKQMQGAMEKAAQLDAEGKKDEAEEVRRRANQKRQAAIEEHQRAMQAKMRDRHAQEGPDHRHERMEGERGGPKEREPRDAGPGRPDGPDHRPDGPPRSETERKLHHVEKAIAHLREAGLPDPATNLERIAQRLRNALHEEHAGHDGPRPDGPPRDPEMSALRREIEELKQAVRDLAEKGEKHH
jgi:hypothetical protein